LCMSDGRLVRSAKLADEWPLGSTSCRAVTRHRFIAGVILERSRAALRDRAR
jgi:hypothetical protein